MAKKQSLPATPRPAVVKDSSLRPRVGEIYTGEDWDPTAELQSDSNTEVDEAVPRAASPQPTGASGIKDAWKQLPRRYKFIVIFTYTMFIFLALFAFVLGQYFPYQTSYLHRHVVDSPPEGLAPMDPAFQPPSESESAKRSLDSAIVAATSSSVVTVTAPSQTASAAPQTSASDRPTRRVPVVFHA